MDFEACTDYSTNFLPWTTVDGDGITTYGSNDYEWTGESTAFAFMAMNPADAAVATPIADAHGGVRCGMAISPGDASQADDWFISDLLSLGNTSSFTMWVLTVKDDWGLEDYEVLVSTSDNNVSSFSVLPDGASQQAPNVWTQMTYDLSSYDNQDIYLAIHYTSTDKFMFFIDDMEVITSSTPVTAPVADFTASATTVCEGEQITFTDASTDATSYSWAFEGGTPATSTDQNPVVTYAAAGTYNVSLTVTNAAGSDTKTSNNLISVEALPANDLGGDQMICSTETITLDPGNNPGASYLWSTGETTRAIDVSAEGTYTLSITENGCTSVDAVVVTFYTDPVVSLGSDINTCVGATVTLDAQNSGSGYDWSTNETSQTIDVTTADTYSVTVTDGNGCTGEDAIVVTFDTGLTVDLGGDQDICDGDPLTLDALNAGSTYDWNTGSTSQTVDASVGGTFAVTVTDGSGCTGTDQAVITVNSLPVVDLGSNQTDCEGAVITLDALNNGAAFNWSTGETSQTIDVTTTNTYSVDITDGNGCVGTGSVDIVINPNPVVDLGADIIECEGTTVTLDAQNAGASYEWSTGAATQTINPVNSDTYSVTVTDNGCTGTDVVTVTFNANPVISFDVTNETNSGACDGAATANPTGSAPFVYSWSTGSAGTQTFSPGGTGACGANTTVTFDLAVSGVGVMDGTYVSLETACIDITHTRLARLESVNLISPQGTSVMLTGNIGGNNDDYTSTCFNMAGADGNIADGSAPYTGTFIPMGTFVDFIGEDADGTWQLEITCSATGGDLNSWDLTFNTNSYVITQGITDLCAGDYTVTVTDANGCETAQTVTVGSGAAPIADFDASSVSVCAGSSIDFTDNSSNTPTSWSWFFEGGTPETSTAQNPTGITYAASGNYYVELTVSNLDGTNTITKSGYISVKDLPDVAANASANPVCIGDMVTLTGTGASTYTWDQSVTDGIAFTPVDGTTYTVIGTDVNGCENTDNVTISVVDLPSVTASATDTEVCEGTEITLNGGGADSYVWDNSVVDGVAFTPVDGSYSVTGTDVNGCENIASIDITVNTMPNVTAISTDYEVCDGEMITLNASGADSFAWDNSVSDGVAFVPVDGTYTVTGTNATGCEGTASVDITVNALPGVTASATDAEVCEGTVITLNGGGADTYVWDNSITDGAPFTAIEGTYSVTGTDANGCENTSSIDITVHLNPSVSLQTTAVEVCSGEEITLSGIGADTYEWDNGVNDGVSFVPTNTTYTVTGTDAYGCQDEASIGITVYDLPDVAAIATATDICEGTEITLTGSGADSFVWDNSVVDGAAFMPLTSATYTVVGTDANGCENSDFITVTVTENPIVDLALDTTVCGGETVMLDGGTGSNYTWSTGDNSQFVTVDSAGVGFGTGQYYVTVANGNCEDYGYAMVTFENCEGVDDVQNQFEISLYPNPTSSTAHLEIISNTCDEINVEIVDERGRVIDRQTSYTSGRLVRDYNFGKLPGGIYYVRIVSGEYIGVEKLVVQ
jgi:PKD repeat protein